MRKKHEPAKSRGDRPVFLAFDPAKRTGWAYRGRNGWQSGALDPSSSQSVQEVLAAAKADGVTEVAMEDCYYHRSVTTLKSLARISGVLIGLCHVSGLRVTIVNPNTWKSGMLVLNGSKPSRRADQKAAAMRVARMLGASPRCHDEADAVCLAEWAQRTAAQEGRAR